MTQKAWGALPWLLEKAFAKEGCSHASLSDGGTMLAFTAMALTADPLGFFWRCNGALQVAALPAPHARRGCEPPLRHRPIVPAEAGGRAAGGGVSCRATGLAGSIAGSARSTCRIT